MDSLLSNYASSDDEDSEPQQPQPQPQSTPKSLFVSLPPPKSLPNPNNTQPKLFSSLPHPTTLKSDPQIPSSKRVVQFRPPINPSFFKPTNLDDKDDEDSDDEKEKLRKRSQSLTQTPSVKSFLSTIPPPKNSATLGVLPSSSGSGRRSIVETDVPPSNSTQTHVNNSSLVAADTSNFTQNIVNNTHLGAVTGGDTDNYVNYDTYDDTNLGSASGQQVNYESYGGDPSNLGLASENYANNDGYSSYGDYNSYSNYVQYESKWVDRSDATVGTEISGVPVETLVRIPGKRGRNDIPQEIIEVKQDELMKNRPREDQAKVTGIAFGPSYQPVSAKGKPSKLHKRKHQIGSLYFDMRQKEMELAERRSKGFLTKAETQAKYGW